MSKPIRDEFSDLPVSKQRKWQLRKRKAQRCVVCGYKAVTAKFCLQHAIEQRERQRKRYNSLTYRLADKNGVARK